MDTNPDRTGEAAYNSWCALSRYAHNDPAKTSLTYLVDLWVTVKGTLAGAKGTPCLDWEKHPKPDKWSEVSPWILVNQEHQGCGKLGADSENSIVVDNMPSVAWADGNKKKVE